ncbi:hypothetical protein [Acinetobacter higginsii]|uniref:hypothetical protein n=1 Tax=Acinetobacter higginsii TaxID=70347 RepID=UPI001F60407F|nr:hypothetical protein [Acinetobacter higginsii]MCI3877705.1 hypothetical protein [Acinetobacter higginsii]
MIDPYYFRLSEIGYPDNLQSISLPEQFRVYLLSYSSQRKDIFVHRDRQEFAQCNSRDNQDVIRIFTQFIAYCDHSETIVEVLESYDEKSFHKACEININGTSQNVYRIRKNNIRLYLVLHGKYLVFFRIQPKRQNKLDNSELHIIEERVKAIFKYPADQNEFLKRLI